MANEPDAAKQTASRPTFSTAMRSSSYLSDHQQYRPPRQPEGHLGIDSVIEHIDSSKAGSPNPILPFSGIPSNDDPPIVIDSGITHGFSHKDCVPPVGQKTDRLVATLFYKPRDKKLPNDGPGSRSLPGALPSESSEPLPANMAPTTNIEAFPLEPPNQESESSLDHLYGSFISPMCVTSFLHLMSTFPMPEVANEPHSSHRCLDNPETPHVVEVTLSPAPSPEFLSLGDLRKHELIYRFEQEWNIDVTLQRDSVWRQHPRLVVFDMDSTLITQEVIDLLAQNVKDPPNLADRVADITHRAMSGELEFEASFRERVKLLTGLPSSIFEDLRPKLDITRGVQDTIKALRRLGVKTAVLSGGFSPLANWLAKDLCIDYAYANNVVIEDNKLTGEVEGKIVGRERKRELLLEIAATEGIELRQTVAIGDGANDLLMLSAAGLGVAWNAKPLVQMEADGRLNGKSMLDLLYLFGFTSEEIQMLIE